MTHIEWILIGNTVALFFLAMGQLYTAKCQGLTNEWMERINEVLKIMIEDKK